jgi:hypothetical protein
MPFGRDRDRLALVAGPGGLVPFAQFDVRPQDTGR